jgi:hypothetical protein
MLSKIISIFEKIGTSRAERELQRMGYTKEYLEKLTNQNLKDWV